MKNLKDANKDGVKSILKDRSTMKEIVVKHLDIKYVHPELKIKDKVKYLYPRSSEATEALQYNLDISKVCLVTSIETKEFISPKKKGYYYQMVQLNGVEDIDFTGNLFKLVK